LYISFVDVNVVSHTRSFRSTAWVTIKTALDARYLSCTSSLWQLYSCLMSQWQVRLCVSTVSGCHQSHMCVNPLLGTGTYSATSINVKLVHWPLMDGLLHLVQRGRD